jgi:hypothetical protein
MNQTPHELLDAAAGTRIPADINLTPRILQAVRRIDNLPNNNWRTFMQTLRAKPALMILFVLLALALLSGAAYAIGHSLGYIPSVGIVDQSTPLRMLRESVAIEMDGITVSVYQVVSNAEYTFVDYAVDGIILPKDGFAPMCGASPSLKLPDGSTLEISSGGSGGFGGRAGEPVGFQTTVYYPPIPADVNQVTFFLDCVLSKGTGPENWQIPLVLIPAPDGLATPGVEWEATYVSSGPKFDVPPTPTAEAELTPFQYDPSFPNTPTPVPNGSGLYLERVIELPDSYILVGNFTDAGDLPGPVMSSGDAYEFVTSIEYANGNPVPFKAREDIKPVVQWGMVYYWAYEIPKPVQGPLTISLDEVNIDTTSTVRFDFETGPNPQTGQVWQLNLPVRLGKYEFVADSVEMIENGYLFRFHSGTDVPEGTSFILDIVGSSQERGPSAQEEDRRPKDVVKYSQNITYLVPPPSGHLTVELMLFENVPLHGPWTLTWSPPKQP